VDLAQVRSEKRVETLAHVELRLVTSARVPHWRHRCIRGSTFLVQTTDDILDLQVAFRDLHLEEIIEV
jgi:hypothetical protein